MLIEYEEEDVSTKSLSLAIFLSLTFGNFGAHKFYIGKWISGIITLICGLFCYTSGLLFIHGILPNPDKISSYILFYTLYAYRIRGVISLCANEAYDGKGKLILAKNQKEEIGLVVNKTPSNNRLNITLTLTCYVVYLIITYVLIPAFL